MSLDFNCDTRVLFTGNGVLTDFTVAFDFYESSDVNVAFYSPYSESYTVVEPDDPDYGYTVDVATNGTLIRFNTAPELNQQFMIYRLTPVDPMRVDFEPGKPIKAQDLDDNFDQLSSAIQDTRCLVEAINNGDVNGDLYWKKAGETIYSNNNWVSSDCYIATAKAVDQRMQGIVTVSDDAPATPNHQGELWWNSDVGDLFIYYKDVNSEQWVSASATLGDANSDGITYGRKDQQWVPITGDDGDPIFSDVNSTPADVVYARKSGTTNTWVDLDTERPIGNGKITIKQDGETEQIFFVNQTGDTTITLKNDNTQNPNQSLQSVTTVGNNSNNNITLGPTVPTSEDPTKITLDASEGIGTFNGLVEAGGGVSVTGAPSTIGGANDSLYPLITASDHASGKSLAMRPRSANSTTESAKFVLFPPQGSGNGGSARLTHDKTLGGSQENVLRIDGEWEGNFNNNASSLAYNAYCLTLGDIRKTTTSYDKPISGYGSGSRVAADDNWVGFRAVECIAADQEKANSYIGFKSQVTNKDASTSNGAFNFYASGTAPNFFQANTYIGGTTAEDTRELWESTLTEEQKEQLSAGTLAIPANVSTPGDGSFARQWWYNQQSAEDQALIDGGELEYPTHLAAATFTDTFALGDNTNINLNSNGQIKALRLEILDAPGGTVNNSINGSGNASFARNVATGAVYTDIIGASTFNDPRNESSLSFLPVNSESCVTLTAKPTIVPDSSWAAFSVTCSQPQGTTIRDGYFFLAQTSEDIAVSGGSGLALYGGAINHAISSNQYAAVFKATNILDGNGTSAAVNAGFYSALSATNANNYNFYGAGNAPNYFKGATTISQDVDFLGSFETAPSQYGEGGFYVNEYGSVLSRQVNSNAETANILIRRVGASEVATATDAAIQFTYTKLGAGAINVGNTAYGAIRMDGSGAWMIDGTSDYRAKENIADLPSAVDAIKSLRPVNYNYTWAPGRTRPGFVAHELQETLPVAVVGTKDAAEAIGTLADYDGTVLQTEVTEPSAEELTYTVEVVDETQPTIEGQEPRMVEITRTRTWTATGTRPVYQGVDQTKLIPLLTKALQEALARIEVLEAEHATLMNGGN